MKLLRSGLGVEEAGPEESKRIAQALEAFKFKHNVIKLKHVLLNNSSAATA